jgi:hypothetical protein
VFVARTELAADFAAAIRGMPKEDLLSQELRQQKRALRQAIAAAAALLILAGVAGVAATVAVAQEQRDLATKNEKLARANEERARAQRDQAAARPAYWDRGPILTAQPASPVPARNRGRARPSRSILPRKGARSRKPYPARFVCGWLTKVRGVLPADSG